MTRGSIIHGVLLVVVLIFAYQTWTKEEKVERTTGDIEVWNIAAESIEAVTYDTEDRTVRVEKRSQGDESYFWGIDKRTIRKPAPPAKKPTPEDPAPEPPVEPEPEIKTREFAIGSNGDKLIENLSELRALRDLGQPGEEDLKEYGLQDAEDNVTIYVGGKTRSLTVGGKVYGGSDRYVIEPDSGKAYVLSGEVLKNLLTGESGLRLRKLHKYEDDEVGKAVVAVGDKKRTLVRITVTGDDGKETKNWADAASPDKPDQTMANFLQNFGKLRPSQYEPELDVKELKLLARVDYQTAKGENLGWIELYEQSFEEEPEPAETEAAPEGGAAGTDAAAGGAADKDAAAADKDAAAADKDAAAADKDAAAGAEADAKAGEEGAKPEPAKKDRPTPPARPLYYVRTEATRALASVSPAIATRITNDIEQIFSE